jgi:hypothetical protein
MTECATDLCRLTFAIPELSESARDRRAKNEFAVKNPTARRGRSLVVERDFKRVMAGSAAVARLEPGPARQRAVRECVALK